jgi:hypothetical protein
MAVMQPRSGEKLGWLGGFAGGFLWIPALARRRAGRRSNRARYDNPTMRYSSQSDHRANREFWEVVTPDTIFDFDFDAAISMPS